jgi:pyridoxal phosphate enzyme (YggS family)
MDSVATAAARSGRRAEDIIVVAVTKYASMDQVRDLLALGHVDLGESRVQNLVQRSAQVQEYLDRCHQLGIGRTPRLPREARWHMVGHLQRNKVRKVLDRVRLIHSIDSLRLAEEIQGCAAKLEHPIEVLIQVNVDSERAKFGVVPAATRHLVEQIDTMINIRPRGLMCMAPWAGDPEEARPVFERCAELMRDINRAGVGGDRFNVLSMGMTNDYEVAVECGANVVRIGTAIFGEGQSTEEDAGE